MNPDTIVVVSASIGAGHDGAAHELGRRLYPLASRVLGQLRLTGRLGAPVVAMLTDPSVHPLCVSSGVDLHLAPNPEAVAVVGPSATLVAPVVDPAFHPRATQAEVTVTRRRLGLPAGRIAVIVAGSWGVGDVEQTASDIVATGLATPVVVCGRNEALRRRLNGGPVVALGWQDDMPALLRAADVVVQNAGGLSSMEALTTGIPVISYRCLPGHGAANAGHLSRSGLSPWPADPEQFEYSLRHALHGDLRERQQAAFARLAGEADAAVVIASTARRWSTAPRRTEAAASP